MSGSLENKVIIVTGAAAGIGLGILKAVIGAGARATGFDISSDGLRRIRCAGAEAMQVDVTDAQALTEAIQDVRAREGRLDGLVSNAGITEMAPFLEADIDHWDKLYRVNQRSVLVGCRAAARIMAEDGTKGALVNIASVHADATDHGFEGYAATKGAIVAATRAMAWSLGPQGIRANCLSPGLTMTERAASAAEDPAIDQMFRSWQANGTVPTPDDMGALAVFLLSDAAYALNGANIVADQATSARLFGVGR
ncbi:MULTISPECIES: SDR family NAD(P)-dependent oxidoreductase [unclassified Ruegeria]|uniref:SDR family NAD(P)-dependent oxidoreductase n=1 Tax=unclassified Ruegeria TaxID=2625375 RepID=UPI00148871FD|nr:MULTISPECIES: SDR family oxidoreductase [unclassified Ruegeria]